MRKLLPAMLLCLGSVAGLPARAAMTESAMPGADGVRIHLLEAGPGDAAHAMFFDQPTVFDHALEDFISGKTP